MNRNAIDNDNYRVMYFGMCMTEVQPFPKISQVPVHLFGKNALYVCFNQCRIRYYDVGIKLKTMDNGYLFSGHLIMKQCDFDDKKIPFAYSEKLKNAKSFFFVIGRQETKQIDEIDRTLGKKK
eukprot:146570_1